MASKKYAYILSCVLFCFMFSMTVLLLKNQITLHCDIVGYNITIEETIEETSENYKLYAIINVSCTDECESGTVYKFIAEGKDEDWVIDQYPTNPKTCFRSDVEDCDQVIFLTTNNDIWGVIFILWFVLVILVVCMFSSIYSYNYVYNR